MVTQRRNAGGLAGVILLVRRGTWQGVFANPTLPAAPTDQVVERRTPPTQP